MKKKKEEIITLKRDVNYIPGVVKSWSPEQMVDLSKVPEHVKKQA